MADDSPQLNYVTSNRFYVEIESRITAAFSECSGVSFQVKCDKHMEGGVNDQQRLILGQTEFSDITLKRGITDDLVFLEWIGKLLAVRRGNTRLKDLRRNINILSFNQAGETMQCWTLIGAVPVGWQGPSYSADSNNVAVEELTIAYEGLNVATGQNRNGSGGALYLDRRGPSGYFSSN
ncbi:MAG: phage tail protein [Cyanobacteria bacterium J06597_1]